MVVGSLELHPVPDAVGVLAEYSEAYPEVPVEAWEPYRELYPELFSGGSWRVPCNCFLVRSGGVTILVDTGVGPPGLWDWTAEREGELPGALADLGVRPGDIDIVFLTHLHIDHVGWNTDIRIGTGVWRTAAAAARLVGRRATARAGSLSAVESSAAETPTTDADPAAAESTPIPSSAAQSNTSPVVAFQ